MNEDLNNTNGLDQVFKNNYDQSNKESFNKYINTKSNYNNSYHTNNINMFETTNDNSKLDDCDSSDSDLDNIEQSFFSDTKKSNVYRQGFFKSKKSIINIDSNNRKKITSYTKITSFTLPNNPFISEYQTNIIKVFGVNPFNLEDIKNTQIIFQNLSLDDEYTTFGINRNYLEYDSTKLNTIFTVQDVIMNEDLSNTFVIKLSDNYNVSVIKSNNFGGNSVSCTVISNLEFGYSDPSHYKITLDKTYSNVYKVRLLSTGIPNTAYTINSNYKETNFQGNVLKTNVNNKLSWINEEDYVDTFNIRMYSDEIYFKSVNKDVLFTNDELSTTDKKMKYSGLIWDKIKLNETLLKSFSEISNINSVYFDNNSNKDFFSHILLTLESNFRHPDTGIILSATSNPTTGKYWLGSSYHNFQKSFLYSLEDTIIRNENCNIQFDINQYNNNIIQLKKNKPYFHHYYSKLLQKYEDIDIDLSDILTFKNIDNLGIPKFLGYFIYENEKKNGINSGLISEFIEITNLNSTYIYPSISQLSEKYIAPVLFPNNEEKEINLNLKNYRRFPIYNTLLKDGKYLQKPFIFELQKTLNNTNNMIFNYKSQTFNKIKHSISNNYSDLQKKYFNVNINNNSNLIDIRQYKLIDYYKKSSNVNNNMVFYNEGFPYIILKPQGHQFNTGDKIFIKDFTSKDGIDEQDVNGEKTVKNLPTYKMFVRMIYPLPNLTYLDQDKYFENIIGSTLNMNNISEELSFKRDLRKFSINSDQYTGNETYLNNVNNHYYGNFNGKGNYYNKQGNSSHSDKESYPLKTRGDNKNRLYGDFNNLAEYKFGVFSEKKNPLNKYNFKPPFSKSLSNMDDGNLLHRLDVIDKYEKREQTDTLLTNMNYFGSKLVNSVGNESIYPENYEEFLQNEINSGGVELSMLENEIFIKLSNINNIDDDTTIGRINNIPNNRQSLSNGNYEVYFDLLSNSKIGNFSVGDIIYCLESNSIGMIVPETWDYDGLPIEPVILKGMGSYLIEKFKKNYLFLNNLVKSSKRGYYEDIIKFAFDLNFWKLEKINNGEKYIYINIKNSPNKSRLSGIKTSNLKLYKPIKYKFLFEDNINPNNILNLSEQEFSYSQTNTIKYDINTIKKSYLSGIYNNSKNNYLIIETNNINNFQKGDKIYIKDHKLINKYRNNLLKKKLDIHNIKPFRSYLAELKNIFNNLSNKYKLEDEEIIPFKNINLIYDYNLKSFKYCLGNEYVSSSYIPKKNYISFNNSNIFTLGMRDRLINWFFDNPFLWNSNNLEKTMKFYKTYIPSLENKKVIIKLIVSPLDSFGRTFLSNKSNEYADKNGTNFNDVILKEGPYFNLENGGLVEYERNSKTVLPFLKGMGIYSWLKYNEDDKSVSNSDKPTLLGKVLGTSLLSIKDYIDNYNILSYIHMFPKPENEYEQIIAPNLFNGSSRVPGIDYSVESVSIINTGNDYTEYTKIIFPDPYGSTQEGNTFNYTISETLSVQFNFINKQIIFSSEINDLINYIDRLDKVNIEIYNDENEIITNSFFNNNIFTVTNNVTFINNNTIIDFVESNISINHDTLLFNTGSIQLNIFYKHLHQGKKAEGVPIIQNGQITGVNIIESGGGYIVNKIDNIENSSQQINLIFSDIEGGGSGASGYINLTRTSPTYALYVELNEDVFEIKNGVSVGFKEKMIELFKRGNNLYFNTQYYKGDGEFEESGFEINTDKNISKNMSEKDYQSFDNFYWKNRSAAATIYQGYLIHESNSDQEIHNNAELLHFLYGEATSGEKIINNNTQWFYFKPESNTTHKIYLKSNSSIKVKLYESTQLNIPINDIDIGVYSNNYFITDSILDINKIYYLEIIGLHNSESKYEIFIDFSFNYEYSYYNDMDSINYNDMDSINYNDMDSINYNDINPIDYIDISEYFTLHSDNKAMGSVILTGLSIGFKGDVDNFKFKSMITTEAYFTLEQYNNSHVTIDIYDINNDYIVPSYKNLNQLQFRVQEGQSYYIRIYSNKDTQESIDYNLTGIITQSPTVDDNYSESKNVPTDQNDIIEDIGNNSDEVKYFVSGHLEYFYQSFLQNKCVINYSQPLSKEEEMFLNKHQIPETNKKFEINQDNNINDNNTVNYTNKNFIDFKNRVNEFNPETYSIHSFSSFDKIFLYHNDKLKSKYTDTTSKNHFNIGKIAIDPISNEIITENTGINEGTYDVIIPLWNGEYNNILKFEQINSHKNIIINLDFSDEIEKGFMNNGKIRATGQQSNICGNNSSYYQNSITEDLLLENQFNIVESFLTFLLNYNKRGSKFILLHNTDFFHPNEEMITKNDLLIIGGTVYGKDSIFPTQDKKKNVSSISELSIVKNVIHLENSNILIEINSELLNDHSSDEIIINRYKYGELNRHLINNCSKYQVYIKKYIYSESKNQNGTSNEDFYSKYINVGDVLCFDWFNKRNIDYNDELLPPYYIKETCLDPGTYCSNKYTYTTQFNRVKEIDYNINDEEILITLEFIPFIYYDKNTNFIIFKKHNYKNGLLENNSFVDSQYGTDFLTKDSIKYNCLSTQPFIVDNEWYTKIFYQGNYCLSPEYTHLGEKKHLNNDINNSWTTGTKSYNSLSSRKVYIRGMKGINIPELPLPTIKNNFNLDLYNTSNNSDIIFPINQVTPVIDGEYITEPPIKSDFKSYFPLESISINGFFSSNYDLFDLYNNEEVSIDTVINNYIDKDSSLIWNDNEQLNINDNYEYNCIVVKGFYLGYGGFIEERHSEDNNIVNSVDGYTILDIQTTNGKNKLIIDLEEELLNLNIPENLLINKTMTNRNNYISSENLYDIQFENLDNNLFKNNLNIGLEGIIFKKKINIPLKLNKSDYLFLCSPQLSNIKNNNFNLIDTLFTKILLTGKTNEPMYNTFVSGLKEFDIQLLPELNEIELAFITNKGALVDFNGLEHSFTIEITELTQQIDKFNSITGLIS